MFILKWPREREFAGLFYYRPQTASDLQMLIYAAAVKQLDVVEGREALMRFDVLLKTKTPQFLRYRMRRDDRDRERLFEIVTGIWKAIEAEAFYPKCCISTRWGSPHEECRNAE